MFESSALPAESLVGMALPLFKGKEKDNYRGITLFLSFLKCLKLLFLNIWKSLQKTKIISLISSSVFKTELGVLRPRF